MALTGVGATLPIAISQDGDYAARLIGKELVIHAASGSQESRILGIIKLKEPLASQVKLLKFSYGSSLEDQAGEGVDSTSSQLLLCATDNRVSVWQLHPLKWLADIDNVDPVLTNIDFGGSLDEIIVFHSWNTKMTIFDLDLGRSQIIKSPKFPNSSGYGYRPRTRQLAILLKPEANDLLTIHEAQTYELITRVTLPTIDAQGLKWSPDGKWIAVWEAASAGTKVLIYTPDGQLFRTYSEPPGYDSTYDLGIRTIEWGPARDPVPTSECLAVGKFDGSIDILSSRTFSCSISLSHNFQIDDSSPNVWRESYVNAEGDLEYVEGSSSSAFTVTIESSGPPRGISMITFSPDAGLLATVDQSRPNVVWIWSLGTSPSLQSALVHEHSIKQLSWHSSESELLIITSNGAVPAVHLWSVNNDPVIARVPIPRSEAGKYEVTWLSPGEGQKSTLWFSTPEDCVLGFLSREDGKTQFNVIHSVNDTINANNFDFMTASH